MFRKLFGSRAPRDPPRDVEALASPHAAAAVHLIASAEGSSSHLGGAPALPDGFDWPSRRGAPLAFIARLDLAELRRALQAEWLPPSGSLLFFYDTENQPWGFDPADRDGWAVLRLLDPAGTAGGTAIARGGEALPRRAISFQPIRSLPSSERPAVAALRFSSAEEDAYEALRERPFAGKPQHQVGGFPSPVQGDGMEMECQLASHGLFCGDESGYRDPRAAELEGGASDWRLLLQVDSDDDLGVMWGDLGRLYFWVREEDARAGDFSRVWMVLQCS
jgi:uncharacterized protein YwqG